MTFLYIFCVLIKCNLTFIAGDFGDVGSLLSGLGGGFIGIISSDRCGVDSDSE